MRLEKMQEAELRRRRGATGRTVVQIIWLALSAAVGYLIVRYLVSQDLLNLQTFYQELSIPTTIPEWAIMAAFVVAFTIFMQFFLLIGFMIGSPAGRRRSGVASAYSINPDPLDQQNLH